MATDSSASSESLLRQLTVEGRTYRYYDVTALSPDYDRLPYSVRILLEGAARRRAHDTPAHAPVWSETIDRMLEHRANAGRDVLFHPSRVLLQDFTGVPALVDLAALRDVVQDEGGDVEIIDSLCPADLVVDHSVQLDFSTVAAAAEKKKKQRQQQQQQQSPRETPSDPSNFLLSQQMSEMSLGPAPPSPAPAPAPTIILHSTFPPPNLSGGAYYAAPYPTGVAPVAVAPPPPAAYYPVNQYPTYYAPLTVESTLLPPPPPTQSFQPLLPPPPPIASPQPPPPPIASPQPPPPSSTLPKVDDIPDDNPGLPIQDEICPFHQRLSYWSDLLQKSQEQEFQRNFERFQFLKWVNQSFGNITVIPPGTGIMHQVNLEYLARIVTCQDDLLYPDSLIGTDSHTTMINGLGVLGWGVGTLDAESVMFGHPISLSLPPVVGCRLFGQIPPYTTSTELVLLITKKLRHTGVAGCFVEFFGHGVDELSVADRATISNMCPEYGALVGFFPTDQQTIDYLYHTGRDRQKVKCIQTYLEAVKMLRKSDSPEPKYSSVIDIDLGDVQPCVSGPKRPKDKVAVKHIAQDFRATLTSTDATKGFGLSHKQLHNAFSVNIDGSLHRIGHGSVLLAAITSCSNTSNPSVMLGAGLLARKAIEAGLSVAKYAKTSLSPGSGIVTSYLQESGVMPYLYMLGFEVIGYGCSSCVDNSRQFPSQVVDAIQQGSLVCCGVLSGNRNFEGRIQPDVIKANYLASPMMVIAYAIAGRIDIDFEHEPIGFTSSEEKPLFLSDIWPSRKEIQEVENRFVTPAIFRQAYARISYGNKQWSTMETPESELFPWNSRSTFIQSPLYIREVFNTLNERQEDGLAKMRCLLKLGDNISSDHISPAGSIVRNSPAADYLASLGLVPRDFNSYGARRGNFQVMMRGTFAHIRLKNEMSAKPGPYTTHYPSEVPTTVFDAAQRYKQEGVPLFIVAGENFGRGAARDWATKGPLLLGVRAVLAVSFDPSYRSNLVRTGILPVEIDRMTYEILTGRERVDIVLPDDDEARLRQECSLQLNGDFDLKARLRLDNVYEWGLYMEGGVIKQMMKRSLQNKKASSNLKDEEKTTNKSAPEVEV